MHKWWNATCGYLLWYTSVMAKRTCDLCGIEDVPLKRWRVGSADDLDNPDTRQVALCDSCQEPYASLMKAISGKSRIKDHCVRCGATETLSRWHIEKVNETYTKWSSRRGTMCRSCAAPIAMIVRQIPIRRNYDELPGVRTIDSLTPTASLWAQQHGGRKPPKRLGLR